MKTEMKNSYFAFLLNAAPSQFDCDFEDRSNSLCSWTQDTTDAFDWTVNQGSTATFETGPEFDHTMQSSLGKFHIVL